MIDYKLAKRLKKAGFPQNFNSEGGGYYNDDGGFDYGNPSLGLDCQEVEEFLKDFIYIPTLSELIEECGDKLLGLIPQHHSKKEMKLVKRIFDEKFNWVARGQIRNYLGMTPEEAVAKLYLALKSK